MGKVAWTAIALFVVACFWGFWSYGPFDLDEGLYAVASMEMEQRGDWVVPTYRGQPFFEKPILFYWTARIADLAGAPGVVALRLPSILATCGTLLLVGPFSRRLDAVMILSVSLLFMAVGRMFMPDPFLVFGMTATLLSLWKARTEPKWYLAAGVGMAIAVLAKGPMPIAVFALLILYDTLRMKAAPVGRSWKLLGLLLFLALAAPWYVIAALRSPEFVQEFILKQNLGRLAGADTAHTGAVWLYVPIILIGLTPFSLSLWRCWKQRSGPLEQYLWAYALIVFVMFSLAGTKLPHYILPIFPPLAILIARYLERSGEKRFFYYPIAVLVLAAGVGCAGLLLKGPSALEAKMLTAAFVFLLVGGAVSLALAFRAKPGLVGFASMAPLVLGGLATLPGWYWQGTHRQAIEAAQYAKSLGLPIIEYRTGGERVAGKTSHPSMQWAIGQNTVAVDDIPDFRSALAQGPVAVITRDRRFERDRMHFQQSPGLFQPLRQFGEFEVILASPVVRPTP